MANEVAIPLASEALVDDNKAPTSAWYRVLTAWAASYNGSTRDAADLADTVTDQGTQADATDAAVAALDTRIDALEDITPAVTLVSAGAAAGTTLDIAVSSAFDMYEIDLIGIAPAADNQDLYLLFSQGASYLVGASDYAWGATQGATYANDEADNQMQMLGSGAVGNASLESLSLTVRIFRPGVASFQKAATWWGYARNGTPTTFNVGGGGSLLANSNAIDGVRFLFASGNIASGYYAVRGYKFS